MNVVTSQCRCNLYVNNHVFQKHYNGLLQIPWARLLASIKRLLWSYTQIVWPHKTAQASHKYKVTNQWFIVCDIYVLYCVHIQEQYILARNFNMLFKSIIFTKFLWRKSNLHNKKVKVREKGVYLGSEHWCARALSQCRSDIGIHSLCIKLYSLITDNVKINK